MSLDGYVLDRGDGNGICADGVKNIEVRDGKIVSASIVDTTSAILFADVKRFTVESIVSHSVAAAGTSFFFTESRKGTIEYNKILGQQAGLVLNGWEDLVTGNTIAGALFIDGDQVKVIDNTVLGTPTAMGVITIQGSFNKVQDNTACSLVIAQVDDHANTILSLGGNYLPNPQ